MTFQQIIQPENPSICWRSLVWGLKENVSNAVKEMQSFLEGKHLTLTCDITAHFQFPTSGQLLSSWGFTYLEIDTFTSW